MVNKRLKRKPYTSPAVEVLWMDNEAQLMDASRIDATGGNHPTDPDSDEDWSSNGQTKRFDFANIYNVDGISDGLELEFDYSGF